MAKLQSYKFVKNFTKSSAQYHPTTTQVPQEELLIRMTGAGYGLLEDTVNRFMNAGPTALKQTLASKQIKSAERKIKRNERKKTMKTIKIKRTAYTLPRRKLATGKTMKTAQKTLQTMKRTGRLMEQAMKPMKRSKNS